MKANKMKTKQTTAIILALITIGTSPELLTW
jgi:hypothetical protein